MRWDKYPHRHSHGAFRAEPDRFDVVVPRNCSATFSPTWARPAPAPSALRRRATSIPKGNSPRCSSRARFGAGYRRTRHRQPHRPDMVGCNDARAPRRRRSRQGHHDAMERILVEEKLRTRDLAAGQYRDLRQGSRRRDRLKQIGLIRFWPRARTRCCSRSRRVRQINVPRSSARRRRPAR